MNAVVLNVHPHFHHLCCLRARRRERRARSDWGGHLLEYNSLRPNREMSEAATPPSISRGRSVACHECGRPSVRLKLDGRLYKHKVSGTAGVCQASGEFPTLVGVSVPAPAGAPLPSQPDTPAPNVTQQVTPPTFLDRILGRVGFLKPIRRIPKAARSAVAALLTSTIQWVCGNTEDEDAWFDLFSFQERVLSLPAENQLARRHRRGQNRPRRGPSVFRTPLTEIIRNAAATFVTSAVASAATRPTFHPSVKPNEATDGKSLAPLTCAPPSVARPHLTLWRLSMRRFWPLWFPSTPKEPPVHSRNHPRTSRRLPTSRLPKSKPESPRSRTGPLGGSMGYAPFI